MDNGTVLTVWYFIFFYWIPHCQDSSNIHEKQQNTTVRTVPKANRKTTKYHTVTPVPTSKKNNKIPHCQDSSNRKIIKYHTVRTVPLSMKNNKISHCQNSSNRKIT
jgi:hypothetical protein